MTTITTAPVSADRWHDLQATLTGGGDGKSCQCLWPMLSNADWNSTTLPDRERMLHDEVAATPPPGILGYVDGAAAGWVRIGPRPQQQRIIRSQIVKQASAEPLDDPSVWAISCFSIRREHRGLGLTAHLLDAAVTFAREHGARIIEAHPRDPATAKTTSNQLFVGTLSTFENAGFDIVARPKPGRAIVALTL